MKDEDLEVERILKMNEEEQKVYLRHFSRISVIGKVEIMSVHNILFHKLRQQNSDVIMKILSYCAIILSIEVHINNSKYLQNANINNMTLDEIRDVSSRKAKLFLQKQFRVQSKRDKHVSYWAVIRTLKNDEKYSFRQISAYLKKYHKFEVTYSSIYNLWKDLESNQQRKNNG